MEIYRAGRRTLMGHSDIYFETASEAKQAGQEALSCFEEIFQRKPAQNIGKDQYSRLDKHAPFTAISRAAPGARLVKLKKPIKNTPREWRWVKEPLNMGSRINPMTEWE